MKASTQLTASGPVPADPPAAAGVLRPHGVWGPGVTIMRNMRFAGKALLISVIFALTLAWVTVNYVNEKLAAIAFSSKELDGLVYNRAVFSLIDIVQQQRREMAVKAAGSADSAALAQVQARLARCAGRAHRSGAPARSGAGHGPGLCRGAGRPCCSRRCGPGHLGRFRNAYGAH